MWVPEFVARSMEWAQGVSDRMVSQRNDPSRRYATHPELIEDVWRIGMGRLGECASCKFCNVSVDDLDWQIRETDKGWDFLKWVKRIDVKTSNMWFFYYPVKKAFQLREAPLSDVFIGAYGNQFCFEPHEPLILLWGWVTWQRFVREHHVARPGHKLDPGTPYLHPEELDDMSTLAQVLGGEEPGAVAAAEVPAANTFRGLCACGAKGLYWGSGMPGEPQTWYCDDCRPRELGGQA
jgi:hypothetical protein